MSLNLFSNNKYYKLDELHKKYQTELYEYLKERKFNLSNQHYLTYSSSQGKIGITIFESCCIDDSKYPERESWHEFSPYSIEYIPYRFDFNFKEDCICYDFNFEQMKMDFLLFIEVKDYIKDLFSRYSNDCFNIKK